jgi:hypothetical protein
MLCRLPLAWMLAVLPCHVLRSDAEPVFWALTGKLPTLELYSTLLRTAVENESILEQSVDGMNLAAAAYFTCAHAHAPFCCPSALLSCMNLAAAADFTCAHACALLLSCCTPVGHALQQESCVRVTCGVSE